MPNYAKGIKNVVDVLSKTAKNVADKASNPKSFYSKLPEETKQIYIDDVLASMQRKNPDTIINDEEFLRQFADRMAKEHAASKSQKSFEAANPKEIDLHKPNLELEKQADEFLKEKDPEFFEELNQAMKGYDENTTNVLASDMLEKMAGQYETDMSDAFRNAAQSQYKKDFIKNLYADELSELPTQSDLNYHLSKDPIEGSSVLEFPETSLNKRYHNVPIAKGSYNFVGQRKPADYYHNILWNYVNKGPNRDAMLDEFFKDIVHKPTPSDASEKFNTVKKYKDFLDKRRYDIDMSNKPYNNRKLNNMKAIEEYFEGLRPSSFEDFESKYLSPGENSLRNYLDLFK